MVNSNSTDGVTMPADSRVSELRGMKRRLQDLRKCNALTSTGLIVHSNRVWETPHAGTTILKFSCDCSLGQTPQILRE